MAKKKQIEKKKKERERKAKARVVKKREEQRALDKKNREQRKQEWHLKKMAAKDAKKRELFESMSEQDQEKYVLNRLNHNLQMLKSMEAEYLQENLAREEINRKLEEQGFDTIEKKINAIREDFRDKTGVDLTELQKNIEKISEKEQENIEIADDI